MNKKITLKNIVQSDNRGTLFFQEQDKEKKITCSVAIQFTDPKEVTKYEQGQTYTITIAKSK